MPRATTASDKELWGHALSLLLLGFICYAFPWSVLAAEVAPFFRDLAQRLSAPFTIAAGGVTVVGSALLFARYIPEFRELVRPIYRELGIIPEVATGIQAATHLTTTPEEQ